MLDLSPKDLLEVKAILKAYAPGITCKVFGSRVTGKAKPFSDLDLLLVGEHPISAAQLNDLKFAFSDSELPMLVDVVDWWQISEDFRQAIEKDLTDI